MIMPIMRVIWERAWPKGALPCPACGNRKRILYVESPGMVDHYQCPCGWFSMRSGGWSARTQGWNADAREWRGLRDARKYGTLPASCANSVRQSPRKGRELKHR